jgi:hypothetical protein
MSGEKIIIRVPTPVTDFPTPDLFGLMTEPMPECQAEAALRV